MTQGHIAKYHPKFESFIFPRYFMRVCHLASAMIVTLFIPFLIQNNVQAQTTVDICDRGRQASRNRAFSRQINAMDGT